MSASRKVDVRLGQTRALLRSALLDLLATRPFEDITIREIAAVAGIGYATFFRHFRDKTELFETITEELLEEMIAVTVPLLSSDSPSAAIALCEFVDNRRGLATALFTGGASAAVREGFIRRAVEWASGFEGRDAIRLPKNLAVLHSIGAIVGILTWWLNEEHPLPAADIGDIIHRLVLLPVYQY